MLIAHERRVRLSFSDMMTLQQLASQVSPTHAIIAVIVGKVLWRVAAGAKASLFWRRCFAPFCDIEKSRADLAKHGRRDRLHKDDASSAMCMSTIQ